MKLNAFHLKMIAIVTMFIDHFGLTFFPHMQLLRTIGRIAFPLFAWLIANGYRHTRDVYVYARRLFLFALISQVPFTLLADGVPSNPLGYLTHLNVLFTLFIGLMVIHLGEKYHQKEPFLDLVILALGCLLATVLNTDYSFAGVASVYFFHRYYEHPIKLFISQTVIFTFTYFDFIWTFWPHFFADLLNPANYVVLCALLPLLLLRLYNQQRGPKLQYFFYAFYPVHLTLIFLVKLLLG